MRNNHFGHKNIIKYCSRPFMEVKEMDDFIIRRWNEVVSSNDTVYISGGFSINHKKLKEYTSLLRGNKVFILGNHDVPGVGPESMYFNFAGYDRESASLAF
ncbi:hydrolase [Sulfolobus acidocaldarius SUSAZ]|nr:hydrolase [Sulfolobus acidocaldarius SUSAZ]